MGQAHRNAALTWIARTRAHGVDSQLKEQCIEEKLYSFCISLQNMGY